MAPMIVSTMNAPSIQRYAPMSYSPDRERESDCGESQRGGATERPLDEHRARDWVLLRPGWRREVS